MSVHSRMLRMTLAACALLRYKDVMPPYMSTEQLMGRWGPS
jgi:hypothetical protein